MMLLIANRKFSVNAVEWIGAVVGWLVQQKVTLACWK